MRYWVFIGVIMTLALLSILTLRSVAPGLVTQQVIYFLIGITSLIWLSRRPFSFFEHLSWPGYIGLCVLLVIPLLIGKTTRGIAGWIDIGTFFSIQPSQLAIPAVTLFIATLLKKEDLGQITTFIKVMGLILVPAVLILVEPDLGTTLIYLASLGAIVFVAPSRFEHLGVIACSAVVVAILGWFLVLQPYQKARITSFMSTESDPQGSSYNARQALIAVGSGQLWGRGLGQGVQSHLRFLPERQTDFIFASLAEELGFIGSLLVIGLYGSLLFMCAQGFMQARSASARYYCLSAMVMTGAQATINIGMNMSLVPITGITLPLLSYGGSSILAICWMYGLTLSAMGSSPRQANLEVS